MPQLVTDSFGSPRGVVEVVNPGLLEKGVIRRATNAVLDGLGRMKARGGTRAALNLVDENDDPITTICAISAFRDGALVVGWSAATQKCYLYAANAEMSTATRIIPGTGLDYLWSGVTAAPVVWIAEGLGCAYIAHGEAADADTLAYASRVWVPDQDTLFFLNADLNGDGPEEACYFSGLVSFHAHLVGWGFDQGVTPATGYKPEFLRIGAPNFGTDVSTGGFAENGNSFFSVGNRVRSDRERLLSGCVSGDVLYLASSYALHAVTGYGADTWQVTTLDSSLGVVSSRAMVDAGGTCYYWSPRGPARVRGLSTPQPLWDAIPDTIDSISNPHQIVAAYDVDRDQILFIYSHAETGGENRAVAAYDLRRDVWLGPRSPLGTPVFCVGNVSPVLKASVSEIGPLAPPTDAVTGDAAGGQITVSLTPGDTQSGTSTVWEVRRVGSNLFVAGSVTPSTTTTFTFTGVPAESLYWQAYHIRNGLPSTTLGPTFFTGA